LGPPDRILTTPTHAINDSRDGPHPRCRPSRPAPAQRSTTPVVTRLPHDRPGPDLPDAPWDAPILAPLHRREILWRLLNGPHGPLIRRIGLADGNLARIARAVTWIRRNYRETVRVDELAALAGMSSSVFRRRFRVVTQLTPIQYQKAIRLQEARLLLIAGQGDVAEISHLVGYDSTSQFSREYRRRFGSPPGRDGARRRPGA
jgi:AraC-like DNA-binding protein